MLLGIAIAAAGCQPAPPITPATSSPFLYQAQSLAIHHYQKGTVLWEGTAAKAQGSRTKMVVRDVDLYYASPEAVADDHSTDGAKGWRFQAPTGTLFFNLPKAEFDDIRLHRKSDAITVRAPSAVMHTDQGILVLRRPVDIHSPRFQATGEEATLDLNAGELTMPGDITGSIGLHPESAPPKSH